MSDHTPGPWTFDGPRHNIHVVQEAAPNMRVCFMTSDGPTLDNARLIAAAPDMLQYIQSSASAGCATATALLAKHSLSN